MRTAHAALLLQLRAGGSSLDVIADGHAFLTRGQATGVMLDDAETRWIAQGLLDYWVATLYRAGETVNAVALAEFNPLLAPELADELCPFRGLDAFREEDSKLFYGRQRVIDQLLAHLQVERLLAVIGPSGSGKSSLVRAGVLPRLREGALPNSGAWKLLPPIVPGSEPLTSLARVLAPGALPPQPVLLVVDQFEETFTLCTNEQERAAFIARLVALVSEPLAHHRVVLTMRSDFEQYIARSEPLQALWERARYYVPPLSAPELREAIERPAEKSGLKFENGLVDALLQDVLGEPAALPLLQFTLLTLWGRRDRNRVTLATYRQVGGGRLALARAADAFYESLIPEDQATARRILLRMVRPGEGLEVTSSRVRRTDFYASGEDPGRIDRVLERLITQRLVRRTRGDSADDEQVEVAHEALVRNWPQLVSWIEDERTSLRQRRRLTSAVEEWERLGNDPNLLLRGVLLEEAASYDDLSAGERQFIVASQAAQQAAQRAEVEQLRRLAEEQQRRADAEALRAEEQSRNSRSLGRLALALALLLVIAVAASSVALFSRGLAEQAERLAQSEARVARTAEGEAQVARAQAEALGFAGLALSELDRRPQEALGYALAAAAPVKTRAEPSIQRAMYAVLGESLVRQTLALSDSLRAATWSASSSQVAALVVSGEVLVWDMQQDTVVRRLPPLPGETVSLAWHPSAALLAAGGRQGDLVIWNLTDGTVSQRLDGHSGSVRALQWSSDGARLLSGDASGKVRLWETTGYRPLLTLQDGTPDKQLRAVALSPDGRLIATGGENQLARVWDATSGAELFTLRGHSSAILALAWSPDGQRIASAAGDFSARIWDAATGAERLVLRGHTNFVYSVAWSPDGRTLLTGSDDSTVRFWDAANGLELRELRGFVGGVTAASYSRDGAAILTVSREPLLRVWYAITGLELRSLQRGLGRVFQVAWSPDGRYLLTVSGGDGRARVRDARTGAELRQFAVENESIFTAAWSPNGESLALGTLQGRLQVWSFATNAWRVDVNTGGEIYALAWSPDGRRLARGADDHVIQIWDVEQGRAVDQLEVRAKGIYSVAWSPDGTRLLSGGSDGSAKVWELASGRELATVEHRLIVYAVAWSPNGKLAASASGDSTVRIWRADSGQSEQVLQGHAGFVRAVAWSPDGARVATGSDDLSARIWDVASGQELGRIRDDLGLVYTVAWSPDGQELATGSENGSVRIWRTSTEALVAEIERRACRVYGDSALQALVEGWRGCALVSDGAKQP